MNDENLTKHDHVLAGLVISLQAMAMQQLGKLQDPGSGEVRRDLDEARGTIDILEMLKVKCRSGTPESLLRLIDGAVMDLQLNYMDELKKAQQDAGQADRPDQDEAAEQPAETERADGADA
jgi:hypothetical protein